MPAKLPRESLPPRYVTPKHPPGPVPSIGSLAAHVDWTWIVCNGCKRMTPARWAPLIERYGAEASSDVIRRNARCSACGHKGAGLQHPSWDTIKGGFARFPVDEPPDAAFERVRDRAIWRMQNETPDV